MDQATNRHTKLWSCVYATEDFTRNTVDAVQTKKYGGIHNRRTNKVKIFGTKTNKRILY